MNREISDYKTTPKDTRYIRKIMMAYTTKYQSESSPEIVELRPTPRNAPECRGLHTGYSVLRIDCTPRGQHVGHLRLSLLWNSLYKFQFPKSIIIIKQIIIHMTITIYNIIRNII